MTQVCSSYSSPAFSKNYPWQQHEKALSFWRISTIALGAIALLTACIAAYKSSIFLAGFGFFLGVGAAVLFRDVKMIQTNLRQMRSNLHEYFVRNSSLCKRLLQGHYAKEKSCLESLQDKKIFFKAYIDFLTLFVISRPKVTDQSAVQSIPNEADNVANAVQELTVDRSRDQSLKNAEVYKKLSDLEKRCHEYICNNTDLYRLLSCRLHAHIINEEVSKGTLWIRSSWI